jgi:hypothetical protein
MNRFLAGGLVMAVLLGAGLWFWQANAVPKEPIPLPPPEAAVPEGLPAPGANAPRYGAAPPSQPMPPKAAKASREEARFNRYDRNRDEIITRLEMMSSRTKAFKMLDKDSNNLLSFEEWAAATGERFAKADSNKNKELSRAEFASTRPKQVAKPKCGC